MHIFWYLPTQGDERYLGSPEGQRAPTFAYLKQIAEAVDTLGYEAMLIGTGAKQDPWVIASSLIPPTKRLKFLIAHRPSLLPPALAARMTATFDHLSEGRVLLNIVAGGGSMEADGVFLNHDARYAHTDEYLTIWRALMRGESVTFHGKHLRIENARQQFGPFQHPYPPLYFGGSSPAALAVAAKHVDVYLTWGEPPAMVAEKIAVLRALAAAEGRTLRFGIRLHVIVRETTAEAWAAADRLLSRLDDATVAASQAAIAQSESEGQKRQRALHGGRRDALEISPNLWAGVGLVRGGAGTALVGDPQTVYARMQEYAALGIDTFVLSGYPHLEEAYRFAESVFPLLPTPASNAGPVPGAPGNAADRERDLLMLPRTGSGSENLTELVK